MCKILHRLHKPHFQLVHFGEKIAQRNFTHNIFTNIQATVTDTTQDRSWNLIAYYHKNWQSNIHLTYIFWHAKCNFLMADFRWQTFVVCNLFLPHRSQLYCTLVYETNWILTFELLHKRKCHFVNTYNCMSDSCS